MELNLRINPKKRLVREKSQPLAVPHPLLERQGKPKAIRCDNGPAYISARPISRVKQQDIELLYIQTGKPQQNAYIERYNRTVQYDCVSHYLF